jgi:hypothetical protein
MTVMPAIREKIIVERIDGFSAVRNSVEAQLDRAGVNLPVPHRALWQRECVQGICGSMLFVARVEGAPADAPAGALSASISRSRALPRHRIYSVERWSGSGRGDVDAALLAEVANAACHDFLCLRATIELFSFDASARHSHRSRLIDLGFERAEVARMYERTLAIDLTPPEDEVFARLHTKARRDVRAAGKKGFVVRPLVDSSLGARLAELVGESFRRTGTAPDEIAWDRIIQLSADNPTISRVVGMFDPNATGPDALVAFAWGCAHGEYATYNAGGSTRRPGVGNVPLSYAPLWDLIMWAKRNTSSTTFDLGGVTSSDPDDPRQGITEFKRYFSSNVVDVGEEWTLTTAPIRAAVARVISRGAKRASGAVPVQAV